MRRTLRTVVLVFATIVLIGPLAGAGAAEDGADCCADLDARIAYLDATQPRKGTSATSLQIYGQINRAILFWNDSFDSRASIVDNSTSSSRLGFIGQGTVRPGLTIGYRVEFDFGVQASADTWNTSDATHWQPTVDTPRLRHAYWYVSDDRLGRVSLGHQSPATDDITIINLGSQMNDAAVHYNNAFNIRLAIAGGIFSDLKWGHIAHNVDSLRGNFIRYDTPPLLGFVLSAAAGDRDVWDVALRYSTQWRDFQFAAGVGYMDDKEDQYRDLKGSASLLHGPTGLYVSAAAGHRDDDVSTLSAHGQAYFHYVQAGISRRWLPFGATTAYADLGTYRNFNVGELLRVDPHTGMLVIWGTLAETEVVRWGYGVEQAFDAAGLLIYAQAHRYEPTIVGFPCDPNPEQFANQCGGDPNNLVTLPMRPWSAFVLGARIRF